MNERIRELARNCDLDWHKHWSEDESNRLEKFAELIVRECAVLCRWEHEARVMLEHFGVEMDIAEMYGQDGDIGTNPRISVLERDIAIAQSRLALLERLLADAHVTMNHASIFISTREKMHPTGQELYGKLSADIAAALKGE